MAVRFGGFEPGSRLGLYMGIILIGYDIEKSVAPEVTEQFLDMAIAAQKPLMVPATFFILGRCIEASCNALKRLMNEPLFELQQHTYSHIGVKTLWQTKPDGTVRFLPGDTAKVIDAEVAKTNCLLQKHLNVCCRGIAIPRGFYRGLGDRPDLLEIFHRHGIRYMRSYGRNEKDWQPVSLDVQPFFYDIQGYPDILEIPVQGWQDCLWYEVNGFENRYGFLNYLKNMVDRVQHEGLTWAVVQHDWSTVQFDSDFSITRRFIEYALQKGVSFMNHSDYYRLRTGRSPS